AGLPTVGIRVPSHPVALALLRTAGVPIAAPSANRFTEISPTTAGHVVKSLGDAVDIVLDGGSTSVGLESTVLDVTRDPPRILRPGGVGVEAIAAVTGWVDRAPLTEGDGDAARPSPGMIGRHYAPRARVVLFEPALRDRTVAELRRAVDSGARVGALLRESVDVPGVRAIVMPSEPHAYAARLYAALHELEDERCDAIFIEDVPGDDTWLAIRDRLSRAAVAPGSTLPF
ncbi:MAG TPA: L-threonylcarbamoyladenylate synthase, partial [Longimicrobiales bacterium]|nr:L-threonylcarbamoyladenylate synthase [Longimicrobiales bacterium]